MAKHFLLLTTLLAAYSQTTSGQLSEETAVDMDGQLFLFPEPSATSYVRLEANLTAPAKSFTVCLRAFTELTRDYSLFSGSNPGQDNDLLLFNENRIANPYSVYVGGPQIIFRTLENIMGRNHICATWDSSTGVVQLWLNGNPSVRKVTKKGYSIQQNLKVILGQEQDSHGGTFDINQSFVGEVGDVHMWDYVLSPTEIQQVKFNNRNFNGNILSWRALHFEMKGNVLVVPVQQTSN